MNVASRIIYLREQKGLTTNKLANMAGSSQSHLREIVLDCVILLLKRCPTSATHSASPWRNSSVKMIAKSILI